MGEQIAGWRKSSYSGNGGEQCVEVGAPAGKVLVRDTQDRNGTVLAVTPSAWEAFLGTLR